MSGDTIVVVDDEEDILHLIRDILEDEGYGVVTVADPTVVGRSIAGEVPALFIIDIMLPRISGIELAASLFKAGYAATPMIAISASKLLTRAASQSGWFAAVVEKPFDISRLVAHVEHQVA